MSMAPLTAALVISSRQLWEQAHACIQNLPVRIALEQNEPSDADALLDRIERHRVDVVLIEVKGLSLPLDEFIHRVHDTATQPAVFVLHPEANAQQILEALRAGAREFLYPPLTATLREAFEGLSAARSKGTGANSPGLGRIMGFLSARGGCGATTFACHVGVEAARRSTQRTLLADFDLDAGMLRFLMKSKNTWSVRDALDNLHRMDSNFWDALVSKHGTNLDVIPAPDDLAARRPAGAQEVAHLMRFIRSLYPLTVVDFGRHISPAALDSIPEIDTLYVLSASEGDTLGQTRDCIRELRERGLEQSRIQVLLNRMPERGAPEQASLEDALGFPVAGCFSSDYVALYDAWSEGHLLPGSSKLGRELNTLAAAIVARVKGEQVPPPVAAAAVAAKGPATGLKRILSFFQKTASPAPEPGIAIGHR